MLFMDGSPLGSLNAAKALKVSFPRWLKFEPSRHFHHHRLRKTGRAPRLPKGSMFA
jgi:hypothetical protein